jgi:hypothetical protein
MSSKVLNFWLADCGAGGAQTGALEFPVAVAGTLQWTEGAAGVFA